MPRAMIKKGERLRPEDIAVGMQYVLMQPFRCEFTTLEIREHRE
jgi:NADP-dependent 3-hydroxy acid dehydrogenase YdfG